MRRFSMQICDFIFFRTNQTQKFLDLLSVLQFSVQQLNTQAGVFFPHCVKWVYNHWTYWLMFEASIWGVFLLCSHAMMKLTWSSICHFQHKVAMIALSPGKGTPACHSVHFVALQFPPLAGAVHTGAYAGRRLVMMLQSSLKIYSSAPD